MRSVAQSIGDQIIEDSANGAAIGHDEGKIGECIDLDAHALCGGFVDVAIASFIEQTASGRRRSSLSSRLPVSSSATSIRSDIRSFELFGFVAGFDDQLGLQRQQARPQIHAGARRGRGAVAGADRGAFCWRRR